MKGAAAKAIRRKRRIEIMKAKRALCKASAASTTYNFLSLPPSSIYYNRKVGTVSSTLTQTTTTVKAFTGKTHSRPTPTLPHIKQHSNAKGLNKEEVRRQRNRLSAENSRQKKLAIENELRAKIVMLEKENGNLRQRVQRLECKRDVDENIDKLKKGSHVFDENVCNNIMMNIRHSSGFIPAA